ncbi:ATP-sensitive inward rectifier potassium channel 12-like [Cylas formicarius]|uniref:ATP-sensitive inward rectifier potassium channel 12-like n=1 Tax=Cylas formicarius TaxID=197179 RepID=UPI0029589C5C|nr:ATP-sensitive inward rectifier potassium channel 12-like [Cylas formicarius]
MRVQARAISKNGECNVIQKTSTSQNFVVFRYKRLVDSCWGFTLSAFLIILSIAWLIFGILYWLICFTHGDFEPHHLPEYQKANNFTPCIYDVRNFASCFLFSMEAQHTLGYGIKAPTDACPEAVFVNAMHCIIGFIMQGFMSAVIFSKMTLPGQRSQTIKFSKHAVICSRNGAFCLMFRVGDMRKSPLIETKVKAYFLKKRGFPQRNRFSLAQTQITIQSDGCDDGIFFNWPLVMCHVIDENSPLYYLSPIDLNRDRFEIVVVIEGMDENTGQVTQSTASYLPNEILWGRSFQTLFKYDDMRNEYEVDFSRFDGTVSNVTPLCSAAVNVANHSLAAERSRPSA